MRSFGTFAHSSTSSSVAFDSTSQFPSSNSAGGLFSPVLPSSSSLSSFVHPPTIPVMSHQPRSCSYQHEISQMMYTFGECRHPVPETVQLVEQVVLSQLAALLRRSAMVCAKRSASSSSSSGSLSQQKSSIILEDVLFVLRRDFVLVAKVKEYLSWRKVRLVANRAGGGKQQQQAQDDDEISDLLAGDKSSSNAATGGGGGDKQKIRMFWDLNDQWEEMMDSLEHAHPPPPSQSVKSPDGDVEMTDISLSPKQSHRSPARNGNEIKDHHDPIIASAKQCRLKHADKITSSMSQQEYIDYADCRQSSFVYKKPSKFREWLRVEYWTGGAKLSNDMMDIMGFIAYELVRKVTEHSLFVKEQIESTIKTKQSSSGGRRNGYYVDGAELEDLESDIQKLKQRYESANLFSSPTQTRTPLRPEHVLEAYRRLYNDEPIVSSTPAKSDLFNLLQFENMSSSKNRFRHAVGRMTRTGMQRKSHSIII